MIHGEMVQNDTVITKVEFRLMNCCMSQERLVKKNHSEERYCINEFILIQTEAGLMISWICHCR